MPIIVSNIKAPLGAEKGEIISLAVRSLGLSERDLISSGVYKISLDARKREDIHSVCSVMLSLKDAEREKLLAERSGVRRFEESEPKPVISAEKRSGRVVVAGFGPERRRARPED